MDAVDLAILSEVEKDRKRGGNGNNSGCCIFLLAVAQGVGCLEIVD